MRKQIFICACLFSFLLGACAPVEDFSGSGLPEDLTRKLELSSDMVFVSGRVSRAGGRIALDWPGSGVTFRFRGTGAALYLSTAESDEVWYPYVQICVDGEKPRRVTVKETQWLDLCKDLAYGEHTVSLYKATESGAYPLYVTEALLTGTEQDEPTLLAAPAAPERRIEFIGDSITCGYGVLGSSTEYAFTTYQEDVFSTYAAYTAAHFGADARYIAVSGKGIVRDAGGGRQDNIPDFFHWTSMNDRSSWDFGQWTPDVVVINAGTNDQDHTETVDFLEGAVRFLTDVRTAYPEASIIWCYGMMNEKLHDVIRQAVDNFNQTQEGPEAVYLPLESINNRIGEIGAGSHPNERAGRDRSKHLIALIEEITGWKGNE